MDNYEQYMNSIRGFKRISKKREKELSTIIHKSNIQKEIDEAKQEMIESNLFLVISRALKAKGYANGVPILDLIAEGNIGLIRAVDYYDVSKNDVVFSTYAVTVIDRHINRFVRLNRLIHVPEDHFSLISKIKKLKEEHGDNLTDEMIIEKVEISPMILKFVKNGYHTKTTYLEDISFKKGGNVDKPLSWSEIIENKNSPSPYKEANLLTLRKYFDKHFTKLSECQQIILKRMFYDGD